MPFTPGQSGNPKGRPKKGRALTELLEKASGKTVDNNGQRMARRTALVDMIWKAVLEGKVTYSDGTTATLAEGTDWSALVKFLFNQIDGPPKAELDLTSGGEAIKAYLGVDLDQV